MDMYNEARKEKQKALAIREHARIVSLFNYIS
jgi:hypothetical protein